MKALNLILITSGKISEATAHIWVVSAVTILLASTAKVLTRLCAMPSS